MDNQEKKPDPAKFASLFDRQMADYRRTIEIQAAIIRMRYEALRNAGFEHGQCIYLCQQDWSNVK